MDTVTVVKFVVCSIEDLCSCATARKVLFLSLSTLGILAIIGEIPTEETLATLTIQWAGLATGAFIVFGYTLSTLTASLEEEEDPLLILGREQI